MESNGNFVLDIEVFEEIFPKHHLQDAGKCMGKQINPLVETENIPLKIPASKLNILFSINSLVNSTKM